MRLEVRSLTVGTEEDAVGVFSRQAFWLQGEPKEMETSHRNWRNIYINICSMCVNIHIPQPFLHICNFQKKSPAS